MPKAVIIGSDAARHRLAATWPSGGHVKSLSICLVSILLATDASAAAGDVVFTVTYKARVVRIKPQPTSGVGGGTLRAILHSDGTVDDIVEARGGKNKQKFELKQRKLGEHADSSAQWRVLDENTLLRKFAERTFDYTVKIKVDGKACKAEVGYTLHPGQTEYVMQSIQLNQLASYSEMKAFDVQCKIESPGG